MANKKHNVERDPLPCVYGCGRRSEGTLMVSFSEYNSDDRHGRGFNCYLPACKACLKGAVSIALVIPKSAT